MNPLELEDALQTFSVIADTREQNTAKAKARSSEIGVKVERATLKYGDYCGNVILPGGDPLHDITSSISADCVIERKMSLDELASCFTRERDRFRREMERAVSGNARVYLLVENASWEALINHRYRSRFRPEAFKASLTAWTARYGLVPVFCKAETSGVLIREILYREMKERLEKQCG